jgi:hypothetical protein
LRREHLKAMEGEGGVVTVVDEEINQLGEGMGKEGMVIEEMGEVCTQVFVYIYLHICINIYINEYIFFYIEI